MTDKKVYSRPTLFRHSSSAFGLLMIVIFSGCASHMESIVEPKKERIGDRLASEIHTAVFSNDAKYTSIKTNVDIRVRSPLLRRSVKLKGVLRFQRPDSLRLVTNKFSFTIFDMTYKDGRLLFHVPQEGKLFSGRIYEDTTVNVTGLTFRPFDLVNIFSFTDLLEDMEFYLEQANDMLVMHVYDGYDKPDGGLNTSNLLADLYINNSNDVTMYNIFDGNGRAETSVTLDNFKELNGCRIPQKVLIEWPAIDTSLALTLNNTTLNQMLPDQMFDFRIPDNTEVIPLESIRQ